MFGFRRRMRARVRARMMARTLEVWLASLPDLRDFAEGLERRGVPEHEIRELAQWEFNKVYDTLGYVPLGLLPHREATMKRRLERLAFHDDGGPPQTFLVQNPDATPCLAVGPPMTFAALVNELLRELV